MIISYNNPDGVNRKAIIRELGYNNEYSRRIDSISRIGDSSRYTTSPRLYILSGTRDECIRFDGALQSKLESHIARNVHNGNLGKALLSKSNFYSTNYLIVNQIVRARSGDPVVDRFSECKSKNDVDLRSALAFKIAGIASDLSKFMGMQNLSTDEGAFDPESPFLDNREPTGAEKAFIKAATLSLFDEPATLGDGIIVRTTILSASPNAWMGLTQSKRMSMLLNEILFIQLLTKER